MRQPPENSDDGPLLLGMGEAEAGEDFGGARRRRMGADIGEPGLDFGDPVRLGGGLRLGQKLRALAVGREHDLEQAFGAVGRFLREPADAAARRSAAPAPCSGAISPAITRNKVVLPAPLRPTRPTRAPVGICAEAPSSRSRPATRTASSSMTSIDFGRP